jgi:ribonuclease Z
MPPSYHPRLVNGPFDDPGLFVPFFFRKRALLFDLGDIHVLAPRDLLKLSHVFVTHTHMDHFIGFDMLLRLLLGRERQLHLFGPRGFLENVEGRLAGYTWNLVDHYQYRFSLRVTEVHPDQTHTRCYPCRNRFRPEGPTMSAPFDGHLLKEPDLTVSAEVLDHKIDCLGFRLCERFHINILKTGLEELDLPVGPWLRLFKEKLFEGADPGTPIEIPMEDSGPKKHRAIPLGRLREKISMITPGQVLCYISDAAGHAANVEKMVELARGADHLFIEASFLERDRTLAEKTAHLTAAGAGTIAQEAGVKRCTLFHFSPRYTDFPHLLQAEAARAAGPAVAFYP